MFSTFSTGPPRSPWKPRPTWSTRNQGISQHSASHLDQYRLSCSCTASHACHYFQTWIHSCLCYQFVELMLTFGNSNDIMCLWCLIFLYQLESIMLMKLCNHTWHHRNRGIQREPWCCRTCAAHVTVRERRQSGSLRFKIFMGCFYAKWIETTRLLLHLQRSEGESDTGGVKVIYLSFRGRRYESEKWRLQINLSDFNVWTGVDPGQDKFPRNPHLIVSNDVCVGKHPWPLAMCAQGTQQGALLVF